VAVASAGPYASLHLAPDREPRQHLTTQFFTGRMPFLPPNQQRESTEGIYPGQTAIKWLLLLPSGVSCVYLLIFTFLHDIVCLLSSLHQLNELSYLA